MRYEFIGKGITVTEGLKEKITAKLDRLGRAIPENSMVRVMLTLIKQDNIVEVTIPLHGRTLRSQVRNSELMSAVDEVEDKLQKQLSKYKGRLQSKKKRDNRFADEYTAVFANESEQDEQPITITRSKKFALKPMDAEEAVIEMELIGHAFYVFKNAQTDEVNVVYRRSDGEYGLIEPEF